MALALNNLEGWYAIKQRNQNHIYMCVCVPKYNIEDASIILHLSLSWMKYIRIVEVYIYIYIYIYLERERERESLNPSNNRTVDKQKHVSD